MSDPRQLDVELETVCDIADRALPGTGRPFVERAASGSTTHVYRVHRDTTTFFVRIAEDTEDSMAIEALVHGELRRRGVRVPDVVLLEPFDERIRRSVMVTTEIRGHSLRDQATDAGLHGVWVNAGRDLAAIGDVAVRGFGFIRRDQSATSLEAEEPSARSLMLEDFSGRLGSLQDGMLDAREVSGIERAVALHAGKLDGLPSRLAHGDFDDTHVFRHGRAYSGIIDFGEMRGAPPLYDAAHYALHDRSFSRPTLPSLMQGYTDVLPLPSDHETQIAMLALLIGIRVLARVADRPLPEYQRSLRAGIHAMTNRLLSP
ncbi:MAG TPA: phosphotransferase [Actinomycetota bacterium]|nr:phosphotransferase [Actinomycetota bacterium]